MSDARTPEPPHGLSWLQRIGLLLGALAAAATVAVAVITLWPKSATLKEQLAPDLRLLHSGNLNLTAALNSLGKPGAVQLSRARRDTAVRRANGVAVFMSTLDVDGAGEERIKRSVVAVVKAERTYLRGVRAFLEGEPKDEYKDGLWVMSERLRERLDELSAYVGIVAAESVDGVGVLGEWYVRRGGDEGALAQIPERERTQARERVQQNTTGVTPKAACANGIDDDGDDLIDYKADDTGDPHCDDADDTAEADDTVQAQCANGIDDDGDDLIDFKADNTGDPDCDDAADDVEAADPLPQCANETDDDGDGKTDYKLDDTGDADCDSADDDQEAA